MPSNIRHTAAERSIQAANASLRQAARVFHERGDTANANRCNQLADNARQLLAPPAQANPPQRQTAATQATRQTTPPPGTARTSPAPAAPNPRNPPAARPQARGITPPTLEAAQPLPGDNAVS